MTTQLGLTPLTQGQASAEVTVNQALKALDGFVRLSVKGYQSAPPAHVEDEKYIVLTTGTGAWAGQNEKIAMSRGGAWTFFTPREGWYAWRDDTDEQWLYTGTVWTRVMILSVQAAIAAAGADQAGATALTGMTCVVTTGSGGVRLPSAIKGMGSVMVVNLLVGNLNVYPATSDAIDALGTNNPYVLATGKRVLFRAIDATTWYSLLGA